MTLNIYVKPIENGFLATVSGLPDCLAEAPTPEEAIEQVQHAAQRWKKAEAVASVDDEIGERPTKRFVGMWANNELFDEFVDEMKQYRAELDANPNIP
jgi:predicted RNase H-like HicB family nuclease